MAGLRGNTAWFMGAKQLAKGTAAATAAATTFKSPFSGGSIGPVRSIGQLAETDANRDRGVSYVESVGVEGTPELYVRDDSIGFWLNTALGADAVTGTTNYTHVITPSNSVPYVTAWRNVADTLWERFTDCKVDGITISAEAGNPLTAAVSLQGRTPTRLTADPSVTPAIPLGSGSVYNFNDATVTLSGGATALVSSFELSISNSVTRQQTDDVIAYDVVEGVREVDLSFDLIFEDLQEYNKFNYGTNVGTAASTSLYTTSATFLFTKGVNNSVQFDIPVMAYEEFPVEPNTGGDPITVSVRAVGQRSGSPIVTATVKNQVAAYTAT